MGITCLNRTSQFTEDFPDLYLSTNIRARDYTPCVADKLTGGTQNFNFPKGSHSKEVAQLGFKLRPAWPQAPLCYSSCNLHFTRQAAEAQRGAVPCPGSHSQLVAEQILNPKSRFSVPK